MWEFFYRLQINDQNNDLSNLQQEDEYNKNYESVEERERQPSKIYCINDNYYGLFHVYCLMFVHTVKEWDGN